MAQLIILFSDAEQLPNCKLEESVAQDKVEERNRPRRQTREPNWYGDTVTHYSLIADECEPQTMSEALKTPDADSWKAAAETELESLAENPCMGACAPATREENRWVSLGVQGQAEGRWVWARGPDISTLASILQGRQ